MTDFPQFSYSTAMQIFLFFATCASTIVALHFITSLLMIVYGEILSRKRRAVFIAVIGLVLHQFWIYGVFLMLGAVDLTPLVYALVVIPNPVFALLYYFCGVGILRLSKYRSIHLMRIFFLYMMLTRIMGFIVDRAFFAQPPGPYNYLLDTASILVNTVVMALAYWVARRVLKCSGIPVLLQSSMPIRNLGYELFQSFIQAACVYGAVVVLPFFLSPPAAVYLVLFFLILLVLVQSTMLHCTRTIKGELENKDTNIRILSNAINQFSGLKHDFYNMLQTYQGYLSIGDLDKLKKYHRRLLNTTTFVGDQLDLTPQMSQNPAMTSLLIDKMQRATQSGVILSVSVLCDVDKMYISNQVLCSALSLLLDAAVVAASTSEHKAASFSLERKSNANTLLIINSSAGDELADIEGASTPDTPRPSHHPWLRQVRKLLDQYQNVFFHVSQDADNFTAYIELSPPV